MGAGNATKGVPGRTPSRFTKPTRDGNQEDRNGKQSINPKCLNVSRRREARWGARDRPGRWRRTFAAALCRVQQPHAVSTSLTATGIPTHLQRPAVGDIPSQAGLPARVLVFLVSGMAAPSFPGLDDPAVSRPLHEVVHLGLTATLELALTPSYVTNILTFSALIKTRILSRFMNSVMSSSMW